MNKRLGLMLLLFGLPWFGSTVATAGLITDWKFAVETGFYDIESTAGDDGLANGGLYKGDPNAWLSDEHGPVEMLGGGAVETGDRDYYTSLDWGWNGRRWQCNEWSSFLFFPICPEWIREGTGQRSGLTIEPGHSKGELQTGGPLVDVYEIEHRNAPVRFGDMLDSAKLMTVLNLSPQGRASIQIPALSFGIEFLETSNISSNDLMCGDERWWTPCPDIFVLNNDQGLEMSEGALVQSFELDGFRYSLNMELPSLKLLNDTQCVAAAAESGCYGFVTPEEQTTTRQVALGLSAERIEQVPLPSTLALLGLGLLLGRGFYRREAVMVILMR